VGGLQGARIPQVMLLEVEGKGLGDLEMKRSFLLAVTVKTQSHSLDLIAIGSI